MKMWRILRTLTPILFLLPIMVSCNNDDDPARTEEEILGIWTDGNNRYLYFVTETMVYDLRLDNSGDDLSYTLMQDSYFYEPGYNFLIFMDFMKGLEGDTTDTTDWEEMVSPEVYEITTLDKTTLRWCWVDNLTSEKYKGLNKKEIIGKLIQEADKGFTLLPANYQTFTSVSEADFRQLLVDYDVWELLEE